ncbi:MAG: precorrin-6y C5,15-methyltransferase (decarboxylating) subunit CbiE [Phormidesmis sp.]
MSAQPTGLPIDSPIDSPDAPLVDGQLHVVGVGLTGPDSLSPNVLALVESAQILVGAQRHLDAFRYLLANPASPTARADKVVMWPLGNFSQVLAELRSHLKAKPDTQAVVLASGDPLFFGLGRLLLTAFRREQLIFHPQVSSIQLAFSRLRLTWQDATLISVHGRGEQRLVQALKRGDSKIAVLTDGVLTPGAIAALMTALDLPICYQLWVCENLGDDETECVSLYSSAQPSGASQLTQPFAALNVVVLLRQSDTSDAEPSETQLPATLPLAPSPPATFPLIGLPDAAFKGFPDRPALITKREVRLLILGELAALEKQTIWDIGAGTGSISVELSRLCPTARLYAIEKTAIGAALIRHNAQKLAIAPIEVIHGQAPAALAHLPAPDRVFIGGSSGQLRSILDFLSSQMTAQAAADTLSSITQASITQASHRIVLALATIEHLSEVTAWACQPSIATRWRYQLTQINISRSLPVGPLTRLSPLNPVSLFTLYR